MTIKIREHKTSRVPGPGFYEMSAEQYHADPAPEPSLSASVANILLHETAAHAKHAHPRLNPSLKPSDSGAAMSKGSVAHELILGKGGGFAVLHFDAWTTKTSREARDQALEAGRTPILVRAFDEAQAVADAVLRTVSWTEDCEDFSDPAARSEVVMVWQDDGGIWCRAMIDRLTPRGVVYDIKTSGRGLDDRTLRNRFEDGFDMQPGLYLRGLTKLWPEMAGRLQWRWVFVEQAPPYASRVEQAGSIALKMGCERAALAIRLWGQCMANDLWPAYSRKIGRLDPSDWTFNRWVERQMDDGGATEVQPAPEPDSIIFGETRIPLPPRI